jgi:hypothetical protein
LSVTFAAWTALCFDNESGIAPGTYDTLSFDVYGGTNVMPDFAAAIYLNNQDWGPSVSVAPYCGAGFIATAAWTHCAIPLSALGVGTNTITEVALEENSADNPSPMALSTLQLMALGALAPAGIDAGPPVYITSDAGPSGGEGDAGINLGEDAGAEDAGVAVSERRGLIASSLRGE